MNPKYLQRLFMVQYYPWGRAYSTFMDQDDGVAAAGLLWSDLLAVAHTHAAWRTHTEGGLAASATLLSHTH